MRKRLLVTGSRAWTDVDVLVTGLARGWRYLTHGARNVPPVLVHAGWFYGADFMAVDVWRRLWGMPVELHEGADWPELVDQGAQLCLVFSLPEDAEVRERAEMAADAGILVREYTPEGLVPETQASTV